MCPLQMVTAAETQKLAAWEPAVHWAKLIPNSPDLNTVDLLPGVLFSRRSTINKVFPQLTKWRERLSKAWQELPHGTVIANSSLLSLFNIRLMLFARWRHYFPRLIQINHDNDVQNEKTVISAKFSKDLFNISKVIGRKTKWTRFFGLPGRTLSFQYCSFPCFLISSLFLPSLSFHFPNLFSSALILLTPCSMISPFPSVSMCLFGSRRMVEWRPGSQVRLSVCLCVNLYWDGLSINSLVYHSTPVGDGALCTTLLRRQRNLIWSSSVAF